MNGTSLLSRYCSRNGASGRPVDDGFRGLGDRLVMAAMMIIIIIASSARRCSRHMRQIIETTLAMMRTAYAT
jgi:hypothetical protein